MSIYKDFYEEYSVKIEKVKNYILNYEECYEGTAEDCINKIKKELMEG